MKTAGSKIGEKLFASFPVEKIIFINPANGEVYKTG